MSRPTVVPAKAGVLNPRSSRIMEWERSLREGLACTRAMVAAMVTGSTSKSPRAACPPRISGRCSLAPGENWTLAPMNEGAGRGGGGGEDAGHAKAFLGDAAEGGAAHRVIRDDVARADRGLQHRGVVLESVIRGTHAEGGG